jgi:nucleoside-diphosphate-sugar epimerase
MSTIVVTGSSGFIGGETLLKLADKGHEVIAIDIKMQINKSSSWQLLEIFIDFVPIKKEVKLLK